jgi:hypothetical protein
VPYKRASQNQISFIVRVPRKNDSKLKDVLTLAQDEKSSFLGEFSADFLRVWLVLFIVGRSIVELRETTSSC